VDRRDRREPATVVLAVGRFLWRVRIHTAANSTIFKFPTLENCPKPFIKYKVISIRGRIELSEESFIFLILIGIHYIQIIVISFPVGAVMTVAPDSEENNNRTQPKTTLRPRRRHRPRRPH
jgi:hypothetical protein